MTRPILGSYFYNRLSLMGGGLFVLCTAAGVPLVLLDAVSKAGNPYSGILTYAVLPSIAALGVFVALVGAYLEYRRQKKSPGTPPPLLPRIDLNEPGQRLAVVGVFALATIAIVLLSVTGYQAYHYTESVKFCGETCHSVMEPEYVAYQHSPHARVACVACHVGSGADHYLRSKITGAYQVYSIVFNKYRRPIETPVTNLRPATETCEQCHWPAKFFGAQQKTFTHYMADEKNTPWQIQTLLKIGGGDGKAGALGGGIHYHMNIANEIYYIASDPRRETIPYVKSVRKDGTVVEYMSTESPLSATDMSKLTARRMDCVDCHNRPSHIYHAPEHSVDQLFETGRLDASLPYLKREGMRLIAGDYKTKKEARDAILHGLEEFYAKNYPALVKQKAMAIRQATEALQTAYSTTIFPEMKTDWKAHPNHVGHLLSDGCFRCHDGLHKSRDGQVISNDCKACHTFLAQGTPLEVSRASLQAQPFKHPVDLGDIDLSTMKCSVCHNGTTGL